ncbi:MAG: hypothetical protein ACM3Q4_00535 [Acidobacteriota bacterium]
MSIEYLAPLSRAFARMKTILFTPFDLGKWFALGFTAFLAHLTDSNGGGGGRGGAPHDVDWDWFFNLPDFLSVWIAEHQVWVALIGAGLILILGLVVVLIWLSSRGTFMFLDNVVHNRSLIVRPWQEHAHHGDTLFLWRFALTFFSLFLFLEFLVVGFFTARSIYFHPDHVSSKILTLAGLAFLGLACFLILLFISKLLIDFVAPIMYRDNISVIDAWQKFLHLFSDHPFAFILYTLFSIGLHILVVIIIAIGGLITCCLGFVLLIIPYIGSVLLLPVTVTFRAFSLEFLEQFGEEFTIFP